MRLLTLKQHQTQSLLAMGKTNKDIARELGISLSAAKQLVSKVYRATGKPMYGRQWRYRHLQFMNECDSLDG